MVRTVLRTLLIVVIVVAIAAFFIGYRWADRGGATEPGAVGTRGNPVDVDAARGTGAEIGERVAEGVNEGRALAADAALTAKIKSKMALDDTIEAAEIDVDTTGGVVTLTGNVASDAQRQRAMQLARETDGVTSVVDRLSVR
jgi:hypothetical protein